MPEEQSSIIRLRTIIEVLGKPREHVEVAIKEYVGKIRNDKDFSIIKEDFSEAMEKDNFWLAFVELEMVAKSIRVFISFCFEYMPSSLEILKPDNFMLTKQDMSGFLNDLQARLHNVDMVAKQLRNENIFIRRNMRVMLHNLVFILLKLNNFNAEQLAGLTGIEKKEIELFLESLIKENKIKKEGEIYCLVENVKSQEQG